MNSELSSEEVVIDSVNDYHITENVKLGNHSICKHNHTVSVKVLYVTMFVIFEIIGNFLLFCMIIYEKYGMDSQKRTVTNQLLSSICGSRILSNVIAVPIVTIQQIFGHPLSKSFNYNSY